VASDIGDILSNAAVDAVLIASSTDTHADLIEAAAKAGKAVFCEKPSGQNLERVRRCEAAIVSFGPRTDHTQATSHSTTRWVWMSQRGQTSTEVHAWTARAGWFQRFSSSHKVKRAHTTTATTYAVGARVGTKKLSRQVVVRLPEWKAAA